MNKRSPNKMMEAVAMHTRHGWKQERIAKELGITAVSVSRYQRLIGLFATSHGMESGFSIPMQRRIVCEYLRGKDEKVISRELKCAEYRIAMVLWHYGIPDKEVLVAVRKKQSVWMSKAGRSLSEIAMCFGYSQSTIKVWFDELGHVHPQYGISPEMRDEAKRRVAAGESYYAIGKSLGVSASSVRNWTVQGAVRFQDKYEGRVKEFFRRSL